ncbi:MAG: hypothetical protein ABIF87_16830 [Pseudomonadota bacterium]
MKKITISLLALTLAVFLAVPVMADVTPYGSIRIGTFWGVDDNKTGTADDEDLAMPLGNYSRFGAKFKTGDISGHVELGLKGAEDGDNVYQRLLYGVWDFGGGTLLVGQDYCPYTFISAQVAPGFYDLENYFIGYGCLWNSRQPQIKLKMANGLYAALIRPSTTSPTGAAAAADTDVILPKLCVGYEYKAEGLMLNPGFAYNDYILDDATAGITQRRRVESYLLYLNLKAALGAVDLKGSIHYGQNLGTFGITGRSASANAYVNTADNDIEDSDGLGGYLQASMKLDPATVTVGCGYVSDKNKEASATSNGADEQLSYFINAKLPVADTFFVVPELSYYDGMKDADGNDEADRWELGLLWQMDF